MSPIGALICVSIMSLSITTHAAESDKNETPGNNGIGVICQIRDSHNPYGKNSVLAKNGVLFNTSISNSYGEGTVSASFDGISCSGHGVWGSDDGKSVTESEVDKVTVTLKSGEKIKGGTALQINDSYICTCKIDYLERMSD